MKINEQILQPLLSSSQLQEYVNYLQEYLKSEEERRVFFYNKITEQEKAEFINGEIICHSPVKSKHNVISVRLVKLLSTYIQLNNLGYSGVEKVLIRLTRNDFEPDICFFNNEKSASFTKEQMFFPVPDFVVEILSDSTEQRDRGIKLEDYALHGVQEYWIINPDTEIVEQYILNTETEKFELLLKVNEGHVKSVAINGFEIEVKAIFDDQSNLESLKKIIA